MEEMGQISRWIIVFRSIDHAYICLSAGLFKGIYVENRFACICEKDGDFLPNTLLSLSEGGSADGCLLLIDLSRKCHHPNVRPFFPYQLLQSEKIMVKQVIYCRAAFRFIVKAVKMISKY